jgi:hypothetical protein
MLSLNPLLYVQIMHDSKTYYIEHVYYEQLCERLKKHGMPVNNKRVFLMALEQFHFVLITHMLATYILHPEFLSYEEHM